MLGKGDDGVLCPTSLSFVLYQCAFLLSHHPIFLFPPMESNPPVTPFSLIDPPANSSPSVHLRTDGLTPDKSELKQSPISHLPYQNIIKVPQPAQNPEDIRANLDSCLDQVEKAYEGADQRSIQRIDPQIVMDYVSTVFQQYHIRNRFSHLNKHSRLQPSHKRLNSTGDGQMGSAKDKGQSMLVHNHKRVGSVVRQNDRRSKSKNKLSVTQVSLTRKTPQIKKNAGKALELPQSSTIEQSSKRARTPYLTHNSTGRHVYIMDGVQGQQSAQALRLQIEHKMARSKEQELKAQDELNKQIKKYLETPQQQSFQTVMQLKTNRIRQIQELGTKLHNFNQLIKNSKDHQAPRVHPTLAQTSPRPTHLSVNTHQRVLSNQPTPSPINRLYPHLHRT